MPAAKHTGVDGLSQRWKAPEDGEEEGSDVEEWIDQTVGLFFEQVEDRETIFGATTFGGMVKRLLLDDEEVPTMPRDVKAVERDNRMEEIRKFLADGERGESWGGMTGRQVAKIRGCHSV